MAFSWRVDTHTDTSVPRTQLNNEKGCAADPRAQADSQVHCAK